MGVSSPAPRQHGFFRFSQRPHSDRNRAGTPGVAAFLLKLVRPIPAAIAAGQGTVVPQFSRMVARRRSAGAAALPIGSDAVR